MADNNEIAPEETELVFRGEIKAYYFPEQEENLDENQLWDIVHKLLDKIVEGTGQNKQWQERVALYEGVIRELETDIRQLIKQMKKVTDIMGLTEKDMGQKMSFIRKAQLVTSAPDIIKKLIPKDGQEPLLDFQFLIGMAYKYRTLDDSKKD